MDCSYLDTIIIYHMQLSECLFSGISFDGFSVNHTVHQSLHTWIPPQSIVYSAETKPEHVEICIDL